VSDLYDKNHLEKIRSYLLKSETAPFEFSLKYQQALDDFITQLIKNSISKVPVKGPLAVFATGGYGRKELCPFSDIDLTVIYEKQQDIKPLIDKIFYPIWDQGIKFDYSVRNLNQTKQALLKDPKVALTLIDCRVLYSDGDFGVFCINEIQTLFKKHFKSLFEDILEMLALRHQKYGQIGYVLEPNIKESKGGLRDVTFLHQSLLFAPTDENHLIETDLTNETQFLFTLRFYLHKLANRPQEGLYLQDQDALSKLLNFNSREELAQELASVGRKVAFILDRRITDLKILLLKRPLIRKKQTAKDKDFVIQKNSILSIASDVKSWDDSIALRFGYTAAKNNLVMSYESLDLLKKNLRVTHPLSNDVKKAFIDLLLEGHKAIDIIETLDYFGVFEKYLPIWKDLRSKVQHNLIHRFTLDRHLLETAANASTFAHNLTRPDLLLLGALLHDIGKVNPGDHTQNGIEMLNELAFQLGLSDQDKAFLEKLIKYHLLLGDTASRRDLSDLNTIKTVANAVGDIEFLKTLKYLTQADTLATSPQLWNTWKEKLINELTNKVEFYLAEGHLLIEPEIDLTDSEIIKAIKTRQLTLIPREDSLVIVAPDQPGLLAQLAGSLSANMISVRSLKAASYDLTAVDTFKITYPKDHPPNWKKIKNDMVLALENPDSLNKPIEALLDGYQRVKHKRKVFFEHPRVIHLAEASNDCTVLEVRSIDAPALLYFITKSIALKGYNLRSAIVDTLGDEAIDVFYIQDCNGQKLNHEQILDLSEKIIANLSWI
jgi:[protein-PII] uridylyltransferase